MVANTSAARSRHSTLTNTKPITQEQKDMIAKMHADGATRTQIQAKVRIRAKKFKLFMDENYPLPSGKIVRVARQGNTKPITQEQDKTIREMCENGKPLKEIGKAAGVGGGRLATFLKENQIKRVTKRRCKPRTKVNNNGTEDDAKDDGVDDAEIEDTSERAPQKKPRSSKNPKITEATSPKKSGKRKAEDDNQEKPAKKPRSNAGTKAPQGRKKKS